MACFSGTARKTRHKLTQRAREAGLEGTYPIGALIVGPDGTILSRGHNQVYSVGDYSAHAEVDTIRRAGGVLMAPLYRGKCTLYTTLEPCLMCAGALLMANIARVIWAANDLDYGALRTFLPGRALPYIIRSSTYDCVPRSRSRGSLPGIDGSMDC